MGEQKQDHTPNQHAWKPFTGNFPEFDEEIVPDQKIVYEKLRKERIQYTPEETATVSHNLIDTAFELIKQDPSLPYQSIFQGAWISNRRNGYGQFLVKNGAFYQGFWEDDQFKGTGRLIFQNGDYYQGIFESDQAEGKGKYVFKQDGLVLNGNWKEGQILDGKQEWPEKYVYQGQFEKGKKHDDKGQLVDKNGNVYIGRFDTGEIRGKGQLIYKDGREYLGEFKNNQKDGQGILKWPDGKKYEGDFQEDFADGKGNFQWPDGQQYRGQWQAGQQHGQGIIISKADNKEVRGKWENGVKLKIE